MKTFISYTVVGCTLLIISVSDWKRRESLTVSYLICDVLLLLLNANPLMLIPMVFTAFFVNDAKYVGGGDIDAILMLLFGIGLTGTLTTVLYSCTCGILYSIYYKEKEVPFLTMLGFGYFCFLIRLILF